jgi:midasin (ATPase involved in ribosome maturation)
VYFSIAEKLNELSQHTADVKCLLVYSDLMENSSLSFYRKGKLNELINDSDSLNNELDSQLKINSLNGITVYLLYQPADSMQDEQFKIVSKFYRELLEQKGARVIIAPNITN